MEERTFDVKRSSKKNNRVHSAAMTLKLTVLLLSKEGFGERRKEKRAKLACIRQRPLLANPRIVVIDLYCHWHLIGKEKERERESRPFVHSLAFFLNYTIPSHCLLGFTFAYSVSPFFLFPFSLSPSPYPTSSIKRLSLSSTWIEQKQQKLRKQKKKKKEKNSVAKTVDVKTSSLCPCDCINTRIQD